FFFWPATSSSARSPSVQNWSLIGLRESFSALQLGKIRIRMTHPTLVSRAGADPSLERADLESFVIFRAATHPY
ncbi:MAG TPA: hypothetical protein VIH54_18825, partial [Chthoniobacterales bacterium]